MWPDLSRSPEVWLQSDPVAAFFPIAGTNRSTHCQVLFMLESTTFVQQADTHDGNGCRS
jgi:hypothetical protein